MRLLCFLILIGLFGSPLQTRAQVAAQCGDNGMVAQLIDECYLSDAFPNEYSVQQWLINGLTRYLRCFPDNTNPDCLANPTYICPVVVQSVPTPILEGNYWCFNGPIVWSCRDCNGNGPGPIDSFIILGSLPLELPQICNDDSPKCLEADIEEEDCKDE